MPTQTDEEIRAAIHRKAKAHVEATHYSLENPYLMREEKAYVEAWFQTPVGSFNVAALLLLALRPELHLWQIYVWAGTLSVVAALILRFYSPPQLLVVLGALFAGKFESAWSVAFAAYFIYSGKWLLGLFAVACAIGLTAVLCPGLWLNSVMSRGMNSKYAFAKRMFGITYPFEADLK
jgi:hypothetical protein